MPTRILIADDSPTVRTALRQLLEGTDRWEITETENGQEAFAKVQELRPDLVILDLVMPVMDGLVAAREISKLLPHLPILMYTLHWSPQVELEAQKVGAKRVGRKADSQSLVSAIQQLLNSESPSLPAGPEVVSPAILMSNPTVPPSIVNPSIVNPAIVNPEPTVACDEPAAPAVSGSEDVAGSGPAKD